MRSYTLEDFRSSAADDYAALQRAIDAAVKTGGEVVLSRSCRTSRPLVNGVGGELPPCTIRGVGFPTIEYTGPETDDYVVRIGGRGGCGAPLKDVSIACQHRARGVLAYLMAYRPVIENVEVFRARQLACDLIDCWDCTVTQLRCRSTRGMALRAWRANNGTFTNVYAGGEGSDEAWWPRDTSQDTSGKPVKTARAVMAFTGNLVDARSLLIESYDAGGACDTGIVWDVDVGVCQSVRFENNRGFTRAKIRLPGENSGGITQCNCVDGVLAVDDDEAEAVVEFNGNAAGNEVRRVVGVHCQAVARFPSQKVAAQNLVSQTSMESPQSVLKALSRG